MKNKEEEKQFRKEIEQEVVQIQNISFIEGAKKSLLALKQAFEASAKANMSKEQVIFMLNQMIDLFNNEDFVNDIKNRKE